MIALKKDALILADAHENEYRKYFYDFLLLLKKDELSTSQLFLMGDIFDLAVYDILESHSFLAPYIELLEGLAKKIDIYYLEGNHDFNLGAFFKNIRVYTIKNQPLLCFYRPSLDLFLKPKKPDFKKMKFFKSTILALAHGDNKLCFYQNSFLLLRNKYILKGLIFINKLLKGRILAFIKERQYKKNLFKKIKDFEKIAEKRSSLYEGVDVIIEGHYHQDYKIYEKKQIKYFNLKSFAYKGTFYRVKSLLRIDFEENIIRSKYV